MVIKGTDIVFGPFVDVSLGFTLGLNLYTGDGGACSNNCAYCNLNVSNIKTVERNPEPYEVVDGLIGFVEQKGKKNPNLDSIVITGGGNPIDHPKFAEIIKDVLLVRDLMSPETKVVVVTSGKGIERPEVLIALKKVDLCILRFDPRFEGNKMDADYLEFKKHLKLLKGNLAVQACLKTAPALFGLSIDLEEERLNTWIQDVTDIGTRQAYLCGPDRDVLDSEIPFFPRKKLEHIAQLLNAQNIRTQIV